MTAVPKLPTGPSPFAQSADRYLEQGLSVMPCGPGTKFPGTFSSADGWRTAWDWQKYCDRLPTAMETSIWDKWPDAGVCLALGASSVPEKLRAQGLQLVGIDIDTEEPDEVAAIRSTLPGSPVHKRGAKGETEFYLAPASVPSRPYNNTLIAGAKRRMLDLLGHGRQTVLPPTVHPDCPHCGARGAVSGADMSCSSCGAIGQAYRWTSLDTLESFDIADLPILPADIADRLSEALAPFGHVDPPKVGENGTATLDGEISVHRALNEAALANLAAWVPALGLYKCRSVGGKYKAVSAWRPSSSGRPLSKRATNLAIGPEGIKDCGEGKGYTPIDLVMAACGADLDSAFRWLQEHVAPAKPVVLSARVIVDDEPETFVRTSPPGNLAGLRLAAVDGERVPEVEAPAPHTAASVMARLFPEELMQVACARSAGISSIVEGRGNGLALDKGVSAADLLSMEFAPIKWVVPDYIAEGLTLFAGAPKIGKSWMALGLALAVSGGTKAFGKIACEQGPVLYLALEDNLRRIQSRLRHMGVKEAPRDLIIVTSWPTVDEDCVAQIELWLDANPFARMVGIDVFAKVKSSKGGNRPQYDIDYKDVTALQRLAIDRGIAIILVHHTRKMESEDPFDAVSGTRGLTGSADSTLVLTRPIGQGRPVLYGRGRDIAEFEMEMEFHHETGLWTVAGPPVTLASSPERQAILNTLRKSTGPMGLAEIAEAVQKSKSTVRNMLVKLVEKGSVRQAATGMYEFTAPVGAISTPRCGSTDTDESSESDEPCG